MMKITIEITAPELEARILSLLTDAQAEPPVADIKNTEDKPRRGRSTTKASTPPPAAEPNEAPAEPNEAPAEPNEAPDEPEQPGTKATTEVSEYSYETDVRPRLTAVVKAMDSNAETFKKWMRETFGVEKGQDLPADQYGDAINKADAKLKSIEEANKKGAPADDLDGLM